MPNQPAVLEREINVLPEGDFTENLPWWPHQPSKKTPILQHDYADQNADFTLKFNREARIVLNVVAASKRDPQGDQGARDQVVVKFDGQPMTPTDNYQWGSSETYEFSVQVPNSNVPHYLAANTPLRVEVLHQNKRAKATKLLVTVYEVRK